MEADRRRSRRTHWQKSMYYNRGSKVEATIHQWHATNLLRRHNRRDLLPIALPVAALDRFHHARESHVRNFEMPTLQPHAPFCCPREFAGEEWTASSLEACSIRLSLLPNSDRSSSWSLTFLAWRTRHPSGVSYPRVRGERKKMSLSERISGACLLIQASPRVGQLSPKVDD